MAPSICRWREGCDLQLIPNTPANRARGLAPGQSMNAGHNLCRRHHKAATRTGLLHTYPGERRTPDEVLERWQGLRRFGFTLAQAAEAMGMGEKGLRAALYRARLRGDPRGEGRDTRFQSRRPCREGGARGWARWDLFDTCTADEGEETA